MLSQIQKVGAEFYQNWNDYKWWRGWMLYRMNGGFQTHIWPGRSGVDIEAADWDTLIVCDACRYDLFCETNASSWFDTFEQVTSRGSSTHEWLHQNFPDSYGDIVYIAGNPMVSKHKPTAFHHLVEVWRDAWDEEENIISASEVTRAAFEAQQEFPNKRLIIHYMQPHAPFYGHPDLQFTQYGDFSEITPKGNTGAGNVWEAVQRGLVTQDQAWQGYLDTLDYVLNEVKKVIDKEWVGRLIVTSDHGNVFSKRSYPIPIKYSGHPANHRASDLVTVPWGIIESSKRREITNGKVNSKSDTESREVEQHLKALGYY